MIGPPNAPLKQMLLLFDINGILNIFSTTDTFYKAPNTFLRFLVFITSIIAFIIMLFNKKCNKNTPNFFVYSMPYAIYLFFITILTTNEIYNFIAIFIVLASFYFLIFYSKNNLSSIEIFIVLSYLSIFLIPFFSSLIHETSFSEIDNYTRFFLVIPVYLTLREIEFSSSNFFNTINITSIIIGIFALYCMLILNETRVRGFTSTALIFGNISLLFSLFSFLSIRHYLNNNKNIIFPIVASGASFFAWGSTGSRGSMILIIVFIILLMTKPFKNLLNLSMKSTLAITLVAFIVFINSFALTRYINAYESTYNYIAEDSKFHWMHSDSIVPRLSLWEGSKNIISDNTLLGVGLDNFNAELEKQISEKKIKPIRYDYGSGPSQKRVSNLTAGLNHAHNQYLDIFVKTGIFGFLVLIFFITINLYFFYDRYRISKEDDTKIFSLFGIVSMFGYISYMLTHSILSHQQSTLFMTLLLITLSAIITKKLENK